MGLIENIGFILALAVLAGFNLYFTIFLTGLAVRLNWFHWASQMDALQPFAHPLVIAVALLLFLVEFGIDKVPWADSLWDSIHTFLRPAGAIFLTVTALGPEAVSFTQVLVGIGAGAAALLTHLAKAGLRLNINTSPEPFSNIIASVIEDVAVWAGFFLAVKQPLIALFVFGGLLVGIALLTPRILRSSRAILWLIWKKLRVPAGKFTENDKLPDKLSSDEEFLISVKSPTGKVQWAVPCITGKMSPRNTFGHLVALENAILFTTKKHAHPINFTDCKVTHEEHFLSESVVFQNKDTKAKQVFRFHRGQAAIAERLIREIKKLIKEEPSPSPQIEPTESDVPH
jgi:hypothetical protein